MMAGELSKMLGRYESELVFKCDMKCDRPATQAITVHRVDSCTDADIAPSGNRTYVLCYKHAIELENRVARIVADMFGTLPPLADWLECTSCGMVIRTVRDVITDKALAA